MTELGAVIQLDTPMAESIAHQSVRYVVCAMFILVGLPSAQILFMFRQRWCCGCVTVSTREVLERSFYSTKGSTVISTLIAIGVGGRCSTAVTELSKRMCESCVGTDAEILDWFCLPSAGDTVRVLRNFFVVACCDFQRAVHFRILWPVYPSVLYQLCCFKLDASCVA